MAATCPRHAAHALKRINMFESVAGEKVRPVAGDSGRNPEYDSLGCELEPEADGSTSGPEALLEKRGEAGIRTLGTLLEYGALAKRCFRPLSHLTNWSENMG